LTFTFSDTTDQMIHDAVAKHCGTEPWMHEALLPEFTHRELSMIDADQYGKDRL